MKTSTFSIFFLARALALPTSSSNPPAWSAPGPGDVRSPCPLLNSLANHNIIPHNGKNLTIPMLSTAFNKFINVGSDVAQAVGGVALTTSPIPNSQSFNLNDIDKHNVIEHDGSLSRGDAFYGDDHTFNPAVYAETKSYFIQDQIDIPTAAKARLARMNTANLTNPAFSLNAGAMSGTFTETSFYLSVFGDPVTGVAPRNWVNVFFQEQRLPYAEGWSPRVNETNLPSLDAMSKKVMAATPGFSLPPGFDFSAATH